MRARLVGTLVDLWNAPPPPLFNATDADALPPPTPTALPASAGAPERDANADSEAALMALTGGLETGGGDGVAAAAAAGASLLEREPAAIAHGGGALKKHSLLKAEDALAALRHVVRPLPTARAALLLLLGRIRREMLPAFAPPGVLRACSCVVCCVLFALDRTLEATLYIHKRNPAKWAFLLPKASRGARTSSEIR